MAEKKKTLVLIDGNAIFHRAYHAIPHLTAKDGTPTNAIFGFCSMVLKALGDIKPDYAILAWDKSKTSIRKRLEWYPEYKAKRLKQPDDFYAQIPMVREFAQALGLPMLELDDYEADDIIGTLATKAKDMKVMIVTNDRDNFQLLDGYISLYMPRKGLTDVEIYDAARVKERYGIEPNQIIDFKALAGDASDNIPGVAGVGEKTATTLLQTYGDLDGIYAHLDEIKGKLQERLRESKDIAYLSQKLATIICDAPVELDLEKAKYGHFDRQAIHDLFRRLEFKSLLAKMPVEISAAPNLFSDEAVAAKVRKHLESANYNCVQDKKGLADLLEALKKQKNIAFDTETDSVDTMQANLVGLSFSFQEGEAYYVPVGHKDGDQLPIDDVIKALKPILEDTNIGKVGHNLKFDYQVMRRHGVTLAPIAFDTMIAAFLLNPLARSQTLSDLAYGELGIEMIPIEELIGPKGKNQSTFDRVTIEDAARYAAEDADISWRLYNILKKQLEGPLTKLAEQVEWPLIPILAEMELAGIELDTDFLKAFNTTISAKILELEQSIWKLSGEEFNIASPAQLGNILFGKLGLTAPGIKRGKTGLSTAAKELEKMRGMHPVINLVFEHRELVKLKNTYVDALPELVSPVDGRIHTSFNQTIAQTGRLSSTNPNLQNIPVRTELGREIRKAFVAPKGRVFVSADYSQIELRVAAALAKDEAMIRTFKEGIDLHQQTAAELFSVPLDQVTKDQRYAAKTINFGVLYGMSAHGLSVATGMTREEASAFIKRYFEVRPALAAYIESIKKFARENEYTETLFGRRRPCPEINSNNFQISQSAERYAVNVPLQGTAADIFKLAMIAVDAKLDGNTKMLLQVHDELILETDETNAEKVSRMLKETMEGVYDLGVPLAVDFSIGKNWGEIK